MTEHTSQDKAPTAANGADHAKHIETYHQILCRRGKKAAEKYLSTVPEADRDCIRPTVKTLTSLHYNTSESRAPLVIWVIIIVLLLFAVVYFRME